MKLFCTLVHLIFALTWYALSLLRSSIPLVPVAINQIYLTLSNFKTPVSRKYDELWLLLAKTKKTSTSTIILELVKLPLRIFLWYIDFLTPKAPSAHNVQAENDEPNCTNPLLHLENRAPEQPNCDSKNDASIATSCSATKNDEIPGYENQNTESLYPEVLARLPSPLPVPSVSVDHHILLEESTDEVPTWVFNNQHSGNLDDAATTPTGLSASLQHKQNLHFVQSRARPLKIRTLTDLTWRYFPDVRAASESPLVKARIASHQAAQAALSKMLSGNGSSHDLIVQPASLDELMDHQGCDYIRVVKQAHAQEHRRHASWTSLYKDDTFKLGESYSSAGALGRAILKVLAGRDVPLLQHLHITLHKREEDPSDVHYEKNPRREASPHRIQTISRAPTKLSLHPCQHTCRNKVECAHKCCKVYGPVYARRNTTQRDTEDSETDAAAIQHPNSPPPAAEYPASPEQEAYSRTRLQTQLLQKHEAISGGKVTIRLNEVQWRIVESRAKERCIQLLTPTPDKEAAVRNAELLSAALAVSAHEVAIEANPTKGFLIRTSTGHARRRYRPLAAERTVTDLKHHLETMKRSLRYTRNRAERERTRAQIKECRKAIKLREEEATMQRRDLDERWAAQRFSRNSWTAASETIDKPNGREVENTAFPSCDRSSIESYFQESFNPNEQSSRLPPSDLLGPTASQPMQWNPISREDVTAAVTMKRNASSPGTDTITNKILKNCPSTHEYFASVFNDLMTFSVCPLSWKTAVTRLIYKAGNKENPKNWRPISLTSALGKTFHTIIAHRLTQHLTEHHVIDPQIQKGFLPSINGTLEHTQTLCSLLRHYQKHKTQYCLAQLDLSNAFGSVPHHIIHAALKWAQVPPEVIHYIKNTLTDAHMRIKCYEGLTQPISIRKGVLQGDTLSPIVFLIVMEIVLRYVRFSCPHFGMKLPNGLNNFLKAFADDLTILTESDGDMQHALDAVTKVLGELSLKINVNKSRIQCMSTRKGEEHPGYMTRRPEIKVYGETIPHICDVGSTFLGTTLAPGSQQLKELFRKLDSKLKQWMENITQSAHSLPAKLLMYKNAVLSRLRFQFVIHPSLISPIVIRIRATPSEASHVSHTEMDKHGACRKL